MFTEREEAFLEALVRGKASFMIVGLAAAALQGAPVVTQDIDLWVPRLDQPGFRRALRSAGGVVVPAVGLNPPTLAGGGVELFDLVTLMHGLGAFASEKRNAVSIRVGAVVVPVLRLDRIIASKEATGRPKDKLALPVLTDAWKAIARRDSGQRRT